MGVLEYEKPSFVAREAALISPMWEKPQEMQ
jgi:hypothetical protein